MAANMKLCRKQTRLSKAEWREWEKCREMGWGGSMMLLQSSSHRPDWATIQEAPSRKWKGNNPPPLLQIIRQWTWLKQWSGTMDRGKEQEKKWLKSVPYFQQPIKSESNGAQQEKKARVLRLSQYSPCSSCTVGLPAYEMKKKKKKKNEDHECFN